MRPKLTTSQEFTPAGTYHEGAARASLEALARTLASRLVDALEAPLRPGRRYVLKLELEETDEG